MTGNFRNVKAHVRILTAGVKLRSAMTTVIAALLHRIVRRAEYVSELKLCGTDVECHLQNT